MSLMYSLSPSNAKIDAVSIEVTTVIRHMHANRSSLNCVIRANFRIPITKAFAHQNVWVLVGTVTQDQIN